MSKTTDKPRAGTSPPAPGSKAPAAGSKSKKNKNRSKTLKEGGKKVALCVLRAADPSTMQPVDLHSGLDWFWIFSQYGRVDRMTMFQMDEHQQLLIQFKNEEHARSCHEGLNCQLYRGYKLMVLPSNKNQIDKRPDDHHLRDFTSENDSIESGQLKSPYPSCWQIVQSSLLGGVGRVLHVSGLAAKESGHDGSAGAEADDIDIKSLWGIAAQYGNLVSAKKLKSGAALVQFSTNAESDSMREALHNASFEMKGKEYTLTLKRGISPNCALWSDSENTILYTTFKQANTAVGPPSDLKPSRYLSANFTPPASKEAGSHFFLSMIRSLNLSYEPTLINLHPTSQLPTVAFRTVGDAFYALANINGLTYPSGPVVYEIALQFSPQPFAESETNNPLPRFAPHDPNGITSIPTAQVQNLQPVVGGPATSPTNFNRTQESYQQPVPIGVPTHDMIAHAINITYMYDVVAVRQLPVALIPGAGAVAAGSSVSDPSGPKPTVATMSIPAGLVPSLPPRARVDAAGQLSNM
ncbi:hypothetical protein DIPPA_65901 [Diplonema papillatum]|nr:hypothetical protein DIPPA_65901 [Diplonema papillatum]